MTAASIFSNQDNLYSLSDRREARERLERLAWAMDSAIRVPGTNFTIGADAMLGLVPGVGNLATTAISGYLIREAWRLGVPRATIARMVGNVATDSLISAIPIVGNFADVFWKANRKNMAILAEHLDPAHENFSRRIRSFAPKRPIRRPGCPPGSPYGCPPGLAERG